MNTRNRSMAARGEGVWGIAKKVKGLNKQKNPYINVVITRGKGWWVDVGKGGKRDNRKRLLGVMSAQRIIQVRF